MLFHLSFLIFDYCWRKRNPKQLPKERNPISLTAEHLSQFFGTHPGAKCWSRNGSAWTAMIGHPSPDNGAKYLRRLKSINGLLFIYWTLTNLFISCSHLSQVLIFSHNIIASRNRKKFIKGHSFNDFIKGKVKGITERLIKERWYMKKFSTWNHRKNIPNYFYTVLVISF